MQVEPGSSLPPTVHVLYLSNNPRLAELPTGLFTGHDALNVLELANCNLTTLALDCNPCSKLGTLDVRNNRLTTLAGFAPGGTLAGLRTVYLQHNQLTELPLDQWLGGGTNIQNLYAHDNRLTSFSGWGLFHTSNFYYLLLHNNNFTSGFATFIDEIAARKMKSASLHGNNFVGEPGVTRASLDTSASVMMLTLDTHGTAGASSLPVCRVTRRPAPPGDPGVLPSGEWSVLSNCSEYLATDFLNLQHLQLDAIDDTVLQSEPLVSSVVYLLAFDNR